MKIDKEELQWWIEDHKSKFYAICAVVGVLLCALIFGIVSLIIPKPEPEIVEEDTFEEIVVEEFDVEGAIQEQVETEEERRNREYGLMYALEPYSYQWIEEYGYGFVTVKSLVSDESFVLLLNENTFESGNISEENWNILTKENGRYSCRGNFEDLDNETLEFWKDRDYKQVLDMFHSKEYNRTYAKKWDSILAEIKVAKGYKKNEKVENILPEDMEAITEEVYALFEEYLLSLEDVEKGVASPLTTYLEENPLPVYENIKMVSSPIYLCEKEGKMWGKMSNETIQSYFNTYWATYYGNYEELFINEGDNFGIASKGFIAGVPYKMTKPTNFLLVNDMSGQELVLWYKTTNRELVLKYFPASEWKLRENKPEDNILQIPENAEYFGYYLIGETYNIENETILTVPSQDENSEVIEKEELFVVTDTICYTREHFCGSECYAYVSEFIMLDGTFDIPEGKVYIKNDTEYVVTLQNPKTGRRLENFAPNAEIYFNPEDNRTISWIVHN